VVTIWTSPVIYSITTQQLYTNNTGVKVWWGVVFSVLFGNDRINPVTVAIRTIFKRRDVIISHLDDLAADRSELTRTTIATHCQIVNLIANHDRTIISNHA
jgi:hypothetical protein